MASGSRRLPRIFYYTKGFHSNIRYLPVGLNAVGLGRAMRKTALSPNFSKYPSLSLADDSAHAGSFAALLGYTDLIESRLVSSQLPVFSVLVWAVTGLASEASRFLPPCRRRLGSPDSPKLVPVLSGIISLLACLTGHRSQIVDLSPRASGLDLQAPNCC